jgi:hypothetical protein
LGGGRRVCVSGDRAGGCGWTVSECVRESVRDGWVSVGRWPDKDGGAAMTNERGRTRRNEDDEDARNIPRRGASDAAQIAGPVAAHILSLWRMLIVGVSTTRVCKSMYNMHRRQKAEVRLVKYAGSDASVRLAPQRRSQVLQRSNLTPLCFAATNGERGKERTTAIGLLPPSLPRSLPPSTHRLGCRNSLQPGSRVAAFVALQICKTTGSTHNKRRRQLDDLATHRRR